ncbi:hypothetical protein ACIPJK_23650 [Streptomyces roseus]|uniref:hypothetical protein n=1 Tax=Streptomyces roseus TaxID=66430 RepID=UPI003820653E
MTRAERLALLGPDVVAHIHREVAAAPPPSPELIAALRPILTNPARPAVTDQPAAA